MKQLLHILCSGFTLLIIFWHSLLMPVFAGEEHSSEASNSLHAEIPHEAHGIEIPAAQESAHECCEDDRYFKTTLEVHTQEQDAKEIQESKILSPIPFPDCPIWLQTQNSLILVSRPPPELDTYLEYVSHAYTTRLVKTLRQRC